MGTWPLLGISTSTEVSVLENGREKWILKNLRQTELGYGGRWTNFPANAGGLKIFQPRRYPAERFGCWADGAWDEQPASWVGGSTGNITGCGSGWNMIN
jgi:hypothetical protein